MRKPKKTVHELFVESTRSCLNHERRKLFDEVEACKQKIAGIDIALSELDRQLILRRQAKSPLL